MEDIGEGPPPENNAASSIPTNRTEPFFRVNGRVVETVFSDGSPADIQRRLALYEAGWLKTQKPSYPNAATINPRDTEAIADGLKKAANFSGIGGSPSYPNADTAALVSRCNRQHSVEHECA